MFVTLVIRLTPFCQIIEILLYSQVYRDTRAYILDPCIQGILFLKKVGNTDFEDSF